jgi:hypothetical protein
MTRLLKQENFDSWDVFIQREGHSAAMIGGRILIDGLETDRYTVARDYLFAMGDNRDDSLDKQVPGIRARGRCHRHADAGFLVMEPEDTAIPSRLEN